jgi:hypothetical protein
VLHAFVEAQRRWELGILVGRRTLRELTDGMIETKDKSTDVQCLEAEELLPEADGHRNSGGYQVPVGAAGLGRAGRSR